MTAGTQPQLEVVQVKDGSGYYVSITWPDGSHAPQQIDCNNEAEARAWVSNPPQAWREKLGM
jgi:hypothetical protein